MPDEENEKADADKLKQRNRELAILNTVAKEMNRSVDLDQALREQYLWHEFGDLHLIVAER